MRLGGKVKEKVNSNKFPVIHMQIAFKVRFYFYVLFEYIKGKIYSWSFL